MRWLGEGFVSVWQDRLLGAFGVEDDATGHAKILGFYRILLIGLSCEAWWEVSNLAAGGFPLARHGAAALVLTAASVALWLKLPLRWIAAVALTALALRLAPYFPATANHHYLSVMLVAFPSFLDARKPEERRLILSGIKWLVVAVLFHSGLQKLAHGLWFGGEQLALLVAVDGRFARVLEPLIPAGEFGRLRSLGADVGAGPFRVDWWPFIAVSNLTYLAEIGLGLALLAAWARRWAWPAAIGLVLLIEAGALELFFGGIMVNALLLFSTRDRHTRWSPVFVVFYVVLLVSAAGGLPRWSFR